MTSRGIAAAAVLALSLLGCSSGGDKPKPTAAQLTAYEQAILPTVRDWGSIEVQGMQPAIDDLRSGRGVAPAAIHTESEAWTAALTQDRTKLKAVTPPAGLERAAQLFDAGIVKYLDAAALFGRATLAPAGAPRLALIDQGVAAAKAGDQLYNQASAILQAAHRRLGQSPSPDFPDK